MKKDYEGIRKGEERREDNNKIQRSIIFVAIYLDNKERQIPRLTETKVSYS